MDFDCDILIAGGGPTGVTLAILLANRGVNVIVVEKEPDIYPLPRAAHIDHECMRILQEAGVADEVIATSRRAARYDFLSAKGEVLLRFDGSDQIGAGGWPAANMIHQPTVEAALRNVLDRSANAVSYTHLKAECEAVNGKNDLSCDSVEIPSARECALPNDLAKDYDLGLRHDEQLCLGQFKIEH